MPATQNDILDALKRIENILERQATQELKTLKSIDNWLGGIAMAVQLNTWQNSIRNETLEFPSDLVIKHLTKLMKANQNMKPVLGSTTMVDIRNGIERDDKEESARMELGT